MQAFIPKLLRPLRQRKVTRMKPSSGCGVKYLLIKLCSTVEGELLPEYFFQQVGSAMLKVVPLNTVDIDDLMICQRETHTRHSVVQRLEPSKTNNQTFAHC